ncbi:MAG: ABC transporter permease [Clostridium sp.]|uniref:ABC transporter permease n=1 Tax=Clostridium sp. TaxID=1506 RepID=UPI003D6C9264
MIRSIKAIPFRFLRSNKIITFSSIFSIMLSVCLILSMFNLTTSARKSLEQENIKKYGVVDIIVSYNADLSKSIDQSLISKISLIPNIKEISKVLLSIVKLSDRDVMTLGIDNGYIMKSKYKYTEDIGENDIIISKLLAQSMKFKVGGNIKLNDHNFRIVEILNYSIGDKAPPEIMLVNRQTLKKIISSNTEATSVMIKTKDRKFNSEIIDQIKQIDRDINTDIAENDSLSLENIQALDVFIKVLAVLVLVMSGLFILGSFQTFLYNYRGQFAVIRSIGGSAEQAFYIVLAQCTFINIIGVVMGILSAYVTNSYLLTTFNKAFLLDNIKNEFSISVALYVAIISFLILELLTIGPALKSKKILPLSITNKNEKLDYGNKKPDKAMVNLLGGAAISIILYGFVIGHDISFGATGMLIVISLVYLVFPYYSKKLLNLLLIPLKYLGGNESYVAIKNLIPQVKKNTVIILSISTMAIIASFGGSAFNTIKGTNEQICREEYVSNIIVTSKNGANTMLSHNLKQDIDKLKDVRRSSILSYNDSLVFTNIRGSQEYLNYIMADVKELQQEGLIPKFNSGIMDKIILSKNFATENDIKVGDEIAVSKYIHGIRSGEGIDYGKLQVVAIMDKSSVNDSHAIIDWQNERFISSYTRLYKLLIFTNNEKGVLSELPSVNDKYQELQWETLNQALKEIDKFVIQRWSIFLIALFLIIVSVVLGVFNSLINNINSKRKEYAILRTLRISKKGLVKVIMTQVLVFILVGGIMGLILGNMFYLVTALMEPNSYFKFNIMMNVYVLVAMILLAIIIFVPLSISLAKRKISSEIMEVER